MNYITLQKLQQTIAKYNDCPIYIAKAKQSFIEAHVSVHNEELIELIMTM
jgi:hypothetical protein